MMANEPFAPLVAPSGGSFLAPESKSCAHSPKARSPPARRLFPFAPLRMHRGQLIFSL